MGDRYSVAPSKHKLVSVKFPCMFVQEDGMPVYTTAHFKLGLGPCGKTVTELHISSTDHELSVRQVHDDKTFKRFTYRKQDIFGRVEEGWQ